MTSTKISICVPIYNVEKYIKRCVVSLMEQTYDNIEYVFINDCTPDNSMVILQDTIAQYPNRINSVRIINLKENKGLSYVRNKAVEEATGDFIVHVDSDDWVEKNMVEVLVNEQQKHNADLVTCNYNSHNDDGSISVKDHFSDYENTPFKFIINGFHGYNIWGRLISRSLYGDNHIKCIAGCDIGEDLHTLPKLAYHAKKHVCVNQQLYHYNKINQHSLTSKEKSLTWNLQNLKSLKNVRNYFLYLDNTKFTDIIIPSKLRFLYRFMKKCVKDGNKSCFKLYSSELAETERKYPQYKYRGIRHRLKKNYTIHYLATNYLQGLFR